MRRFLPVMFAVALSLLAQTPVPSPDKKAEEHPASPCRVGGRVVTAAEGSPLKSARVALVPEDSRSDTLIYGATSDSDCHFLLKEDIPFASRKQTLIPVASSQTDDRGQYRIFGVKPANITYGRRTHSNPITMYRLLMRTIGFGNTWVVNTPRCTTPE